MALDMSTSPQIEWLGRQDLRLFLTSTEKGRDWRFISFLFGHRRRSIQTSGVASQVLERSDPNSKRPQFKVLSHLRRLPSVQYDFEFRYVARRNSRSGSVSLPPRDLDAARSIPAGLQRKLPAGCWLLRVCVSLLRGKNGQTDSRSRPFAQCPASRPFASKARRAVTALCRVIEGSVTSAHLPRHGAMRPRHSRPWPENTGYV